MNQIKETAAFTLAEVVVAMSLFLFALTLFYSLFAGINQVVNEWQTQTELENAYHTIAQRIVEDVMHAKTLTLAGMGGFTVDTGSEIIGYDLREGVLFRQGIKMHGDKVWLSGFYVQKNEHAFLFGYTIQDRRRRFVIKQTIFLRQPSAWQPLELEGL